jgi:hypothetical protein
MKSWLYLFYIWGTQLLLTGILDLIEVNSPVNTIKLMILSAAVLSSVVLLLFSRSPVPNLTKFELQKGKYTSLLPLAIIVGSFILLWLNEAADKTLILHVLRAQLLAFFYVLLGTFLGKQLVWLGLWLFALTAVVSLWYLGFVPLVFEALGGISLLVCGWVLLSWSREKDLV